MSTFDTNQFIAVANSKEFNDAFWQWFDTAPAKERNVFLYYKEDMAKLYFFNKYYSKRHFTVQTNESNSYLHIRT